MNAQTLQQDWRITPYQWGTLAISGMVLIASYSSGLSQMLNGWLNTEEYSHGFLIPLLAAFFIWQKKDRLAKITFRGDWYGVILLIMGISLLVVGELATLFTIIQYGFLLALVGIVLAFVGRAAFKEIWVPLAFLIFMIPLPQFLYGSLSTQLQLISSEIGVLVIRMFGISVNLQGNVIDLGLYKLQVAEACNGLRYLFPLMSVAFLCAYMFKAPFWQRALIFLSSIPITVIMNSIRIGIIGVLVEYWGVGMAEGFLHDFEGWVVFMACMALLLSEMWLLAYFGKDRRRLKEVFGLVLPAKGSADSATQARSFSKPFVASIAVLSIGAGLSFSLQQRVEEVPQRATFVQFPLSLNQWQGRSDRMEQVYIDALKFDDYLLADFNSGTNQGINLYMAYYASQRKGESAHSPRSCIPGDGWRIVSLDQQNIEGAVVEGQPLRVNRVEIEKGDYRQLVYYWFQQRGRVVTNEYLVKWFLFWDALTRNRTDGALVRITTSVGPGQDIAEAEQSLKEFARNVSVHLGTFIPGQTTHVKFD